MGNFYGLKKILFGILVLTSAVIILYYTVGNKPASKQTFAGSQGTFQGSSRTNLQEVENSGYSTVRFREKPLPIATLEGNTGYSAPVINSIKLAELSDDEQTVILEANTGKPGADVILAAKGVRAKWIFRFRDSDICDGKILIERFGLTVPVAGKDTELTFAPWKDFSVTCDKGKLNYYVIAVDNLDTFIRNSENVRNEIQDVIEEKVEKQVTKSSTEDTANETGQSSEANVQKNVDVNINAVVPTNEPGSSTDNNTIKRQETVNNREEPAEQQDNTKKGGILDHIFHHHH